MRGGMSIPTILFYRFLFSAIIMFPVFLVQTQKIKIGFHSLGILFILSAFYAATSLGLIWSYSYIPSGITTTIHFLYPILVATIMMFFFKEKKSALIVVSTLLSFTGVALLCRSEGEGVLIFSGVYIALATVVTYALYIVGINKFGMSKISPVTVTFYVLSFGALFFGIFALSTTGIEPIHNGIEWMYLIILAFLPTVVSDYALVLAIKYAGSTISAILGVMEPVVAFCMGVCFFSEQFNMYGFGGLFLVIVSVITTILSKIENYGIQNKQSKLSCRDSSP
jgi:drug/metabolite transporter (DMT)-like permease